MSDEALYEFLHSELVSYCINLIEDKNKEGKVILYFSSTKPFNYIFPG